MFLSINICIRYFNTDVCKTVTDFLGILHIERANAPELHKLIKQFLKDVDLPIKNMIAIGTDGANNLCGANKSLIFYEKKTSLI